MITTTGILCGQYNVMGLLAWEMVGYQKRWIGDTQLSFASGSTLFSFCYLHARIRYI